MNKTIIGGIIAVLVAGLAAFGIASALTSGQKDVPEEPAVSSIFEDAGGEAGTAEDTASAEAQEESAPEPVEPTIGNYKAADVLPYLAVLSEYAEAMASSDAPELPQYVNIEAWTAQRDWVEIPLSYALADLANDGKPELVIAYNFGQAGNGSATSGGMNTYRIYDLYGIQDGQPVRLVSEASLGYRATLTLYQDGYVAYFGSGGAMDQITDYYVMRPDASQLEFLEGVHMDEGGKTFTFADGSTQVTGLSEDLLTQAEHFDATKLLEGLDWQLVSDYSAYLSGGEAPAASGNAAASTQTGEVIYYLTSLTPVYVQSAGFSGNTFEITAKMSSGSSEQLSHPSSSASFEQYRFELLDGTAYYGSGGQAGPTWLSRAEAEQWVASLNGLALVLKVQDGVVLEMRFSS